MAQVALKDTCSSRTNRNHHSIIHAHNKRKRPHKGPFFAWNVTYADLISGKAPHIYNTERAGHTVSPIYYDLRWPLQDSQLGQTIRDLHNTLESIPAYLLNLERWYKKTNPKKSRYISTEAQDSSIYANSETNSTDRSFLKELHPGLLHHIHRITNGLKLYHWEFVRTHFDDSVPQWRDEARRRLFSIMYLASAYTMSVLQYLDAVHTSVAPDMPPGPRSKWEQMHDSLCASGTLNRTYIALFPNLSPLLLYLSTGTELGQRLLNEQYGRLHPCCNTSHYEELYLGTESALFRHRYPEDFLWVEPLKGS
ncbi:hypothetical protein EJ05DRAFT_243773 [Pseudovirgaria hyperparasitica]|uniref:Uncharacterized protein n=1 Tax=Pseudovirgaria hyperparasitica TaxID=470096 RepID=A0A6A6WFP9_9PEZI|nr:uncharacterized protein EJ05DRAFT_243773 [Pseudovirgaria hyperparasitica]KAF2760840.1 hypothetical protein EJ05DRAFT_243773 [Pseudovirgaria hyperparasitica]